MSHKTISPDLPPGVHELRAEPGGILYTLLLPERCAAASPSPMVTALHWGGPVLPYTGRALLEGLVGPALEGLGAIILAPDRNGDRWDDLDREREVLELVALVEENFTVDPKRTLLTGYSLGGIGTWFITGRNPGRFAAALPVSASPPEDGSGWNSKTPLYVLHSRQDEIFPASGTEAFVTELRDRGGDIELDMIDGVTHFDVGGFVEPLARALPWIKKAWG